MTTSRIRTFITLGLVISLAACVTVGVAPEDCPAGTQKLEGCPPIGAIADSDISKLYADRSWIKPSELEIDPIELGREAEIPINRALAKFIGSTDEGGLTSLAAKLWMIENAEHTIDAVYYIFRGDLVGQAILGAMCDAVQRGVDIRIMIDSLGSSSLKRKYLKALQSCALDAGFIRNLDGAITIHKARVQTVIFNAASKIFVNHNRRSHDKLLVTDGHFPDKAFVMTGGRNISLAYYGILSDGSPNPDTYRDSEILLRGGAFDEEEQYTVGKVSEIYYSLLFLFKNNKRLSMTRMNDPIQVYRKERQSFRDSLSALKELPEVRQYLDMMPEYMSQGFYETEVLLAHELSNLTDKKVVSNAVENTHLNPNSITAILAQIRDEHFNTIRIVSPYLFAARFTDKEGNVILDGAQEALKWLDKHPDSTLEVVTNSVLTSDNFFAQAVIDMDLVPRLLLSEDLQASWLAKVSESELNPELVESEAWLKMVNHPRLLVYETGKLDDKIFGGDIKHSKLHAKYTVSDDMGFVGTTNFDYRSRLYNNEMGFFFRSQELADDIVDNTEYLISLSYRWGSPEWLEMRSRLMEMSGTKARTTRNQRRNYKVLKKTGLLWLF